MSVYTGIDGTRYCSIVGKPTPYLWSNMMDWPSATGRFQCLKLYGRLEGGSRYWSWINIHLEIIRSQVCATELRWNMQNSVILGVCASSFAQFPVIPCKLRKCRDKFKIVDPASPPLPSDRTIKIVMPTNFQMIMLMYRYRLYRSEKKQRQ